MTRFDWCGDTSAHEIHLFANGETQHTCPGIPDTGKWDVPPKLVHDCKSVLPNVAVFRDSEKLVTWICNCGQVWTGKRNYRSYDGELVLWWDKVSRCW